MKKATALVAIVAILALGACGQDDDKPQYRETCVEQDSGMFVFDDDDCDDYGHAVYFYPYAMPLPVYGMYAHGGTYIKPAGKVYTTRTSKTQAGTKTVTKTETKTVTTYRRR